MEDKKPNISGAGSAAGGDIDGSGAKNASDSSQVNIKVRDAEGNEVMFKIKRATQLKKLMDAYCTRMGSSAGAYRFLFDGHRINPDDTPDSLDMQEKDCVDAMLFQQFVTSIAPLFLLQAMVFISIEYSLARSRKHLSNFCRGGCFRGIDVRVVRLPHLSYSALTCVVR
jgi:small ubiquitin-related modifier